MSKEVKCPFCSVGDLSWHDTRLYKDYEESSKTNETDQGNCRPYFMCSNGITCGLVVSCEKVDILRKAFTKVVA